MFCNQGKTLCSPCTPGVLKSSPADLTFPLLKGQKRTNGQIHS